MNKKHHVHIIFLFIFLGKRLRDLKDIINSVPNLYVIISLDCEEVNPVNTTNELLSHMFKHKIKHNF
jgi:hypothetical protein